MGGGGADSALSPFLGAYLILNSIPGRELTCLPSSAASFPGCVRRGPLCRGTQQTRVPGVHFEDLPWPSSSRLASRVRAPRGAGAQRVLHVGIQVQVRLNPIPIRLF